MVSFKTLLPFIATLATAAPTDTSSKDLEARSTWGDITYYNTGLGACGWWNGDSDYVAAVSAPLFDSQRPCGRNIRVNYNGRSVTVQIVDRCAGCAWGDIDLSPNAFTGLVGSLDAGRVQGSWDWA
ncbi:expansin [Trichoderma arundinaceum]|uniref:Expansin n=1 Tax=Trichoderma arundinaceum TaxID=490622 RepID=A0A395NKR0_TRIAR|nr:expansin [Trichoderma arundinaceum]